MSLPNDDHYITKTNCPKCTHEDGHLLGLYLQEIMYEADMPLDDGYKLHVEFQYCPHCGQELTKSYWNKESNDDTIK